MLRFATLAGCAVLILLLSGCFVTSKESLYNTADTDFEPGLVGDWETPEGAAVNFKQVGKSSNYWITSTDMEGVMQVYLGVLTKMDNENTYMDVLNLTGEETARMASFDPAQVRNVIKGQGDHFWYKVYFDESKDPDLGTTSLNVRFSAVNSQWMANYVKAHPGDLAVTPSNDKDDEIQPSEMGMTEITAYTSSLRSFIQSHYTEGMFDPPLRLKRIEISLDDVPGVDK